MPHEPIHARRAPHRLFKARLLEARPLAVLAVACALLCGGSALAASSILPRNFTTLSGTVWQFIVDHSARRLNPTCYQSSGNRSESYSCLKAALLSTGLDKELQGNGPITLFAPNDAGFAELAHLMGTRAFNVLMSNPDHLTLLLHTHMVRGRYTSADLKARSVPATGRLTLPTLAGTQLELTFGRFTTSGGRVTVRVGPSTLRPAWQPYLVGQSTLLDNGSVIPMDMVFLPPSLR
ncbi:MAG: fasciclin domain-containing protein [Deinococcales bacterium]|jgi:uncharacterized surface protein with fasciclin (FAS1) repeats